LPTHDKRALGNNLFDHLRLAFSETDMPRYYFVLRGPDGEVHDDQHGTELPDRTQALAYAKQIVSELKEAGGYEEPGWAMGIGNGNDDEVVLLPFGNACRRH